jgi:hypothetical protein
MALCHLGGSGGLEQEVLRLVLRRLINPAAISTHLWFNIAVDEVLSAQEANRLG